MSFVPSKIHIRLLLQESFYIPLYAFFLTVFGLARKACSKDANDLKVAHFDARLFTIKGNNNAHIVDRHFYLRTFMA